MFQMTMPTWSFGLEMTLRFIMAYAARSTTSSLLVGGLSLPLHPNFLNSAFAMSSSDVLPLPFASWVGAVLVGAAVAEGGGKVAPNEFGAESRLRFGSSMDGVASIANRIEDFE